MFRLVEKPKSARAETRLGQGESDVYASGPATDG